MLIHDKNITFFNQPELTFLKNNKNKIYIEIGFINTNSEFYQPSIFFFEKLKSIFSKKLKKNLNPPSFDNDNNECRMLNVKINKSKTIQIKISKRINTTGTYIKNNWICEFPFFKMLLIEDISKQPKKGNNYRVILLSNQSADMNYETHCLFLFIWDLFQFKTIKTRDENNK
jgi:hypothetical protein